MLAVKPFRQKTGYCGPASLKMVLRYFGVDMSEEELARLSNCTEEWGVGAEQLVRVANDLGFQAEIFDNSDIDNIKRWVLEKKIPVIVDWFSEDDGHYSVVVDIDGENIYIQDPEFGRLRAMRLDNFYRVWFDFPDKFIKHKDQLTIRRMIIIYPKNYEAKNEEPSPLNPSATS
ncbi:C39 family peptidase [Patescibacteria group bacterium]|nr:C39 family peptidase [Patescibacteria group bacterium]